MNVSSGIHYPDTIHLHDGIKAEYGYSEGQFPNAERMCKRILSLPIFPDMTEEQALYACECIRKIVQG